VVEYQGIRFTVERRRSAADRSGSDADRCRDLDQSTERRVRINRMEADVTIILFNKPFQVLVPVYG
jgi:hypothetical protein